jgi:hypothetical protein
MRSQSGGSSTRLDLSALPPTDDGFVGKVLIALIGALLTIISQIVIRRFAMRADAFQARLNELCADVRELATVSGEYWGIEPGSPDLRRLEAKVFGLNH